MDHIPEHYSIPVSMETQIYFPLQLWTAGLWSRMTLQHSDGPRHTSQHYCCLLTSTLLMSKDPFFTLFSHVYFLKFPILPEFRLTFLPYFHIWSSSKFFPRVYSYPSSLFPPDLIQQQKLLFLASFPRQHWPQWITSVWVALYSKFSHHCPS